MALATTTLAAACGALDTQVSLTSATSIASGRFLLVDQEMMLVAQGYVSGTLVNVLRGREGTVQEAHKITANVTHGLASDFSLPPAQTGVTYPYGRVRRLVSITATSTLTLPPAGEDLDVVLNGTSVITLTVPVPTKDMDGCRLMIIGNGAAAHILTFTGGLSGAGSSYDVLTVNATAPVAFQAVACNGLWNAFVAIPAAGTVTNVTGTLT